ncbi:hypothetical protein E4U50_008086 [Claviceps purpurea]|nr:hypothetical protein E4U50_008086 [Claviceps purpurea]
MSNSHSETREPGQSAEAMRCVREDCSSWAVSHFRFCHHHLNKIQPTLAASRKKSSAPAQEQKKK